MRVRFQVTSPSQAGSKVFNFGHVRLIMFWRHTVASRTSHEHIFFNLQEVAGMVSQKGLKL